MTSADADFAAIDGAVADAGPPGAVNGSPSSPREEAMEVPPLEYVPVPPRDTVGLSVCYRLRGRGRPMPYELAEGADE